MNNIFRPATAVEVLEKRKEANAKKIDSCYNEIVAINIKQHDLSNQHKKFVDTQNELSKENELLDALLKEIKYPPSVFNADFKSDTLKLTTEQIKPLTTADIKNFTIPNSKTQEAKTQDLNKDPWMLNNDWLTKLCPDAIHDWPHPQ